MEYFDTGKDLQSAFDEGYKRAIEDEDEDEDLVKVIRCKWDYEIGMSPNSVNKDNFCSNEERKEE